MREDFIVRVPVRPAPICAACRTTTLTTVTRKDGQTFESCPLHGAMWIQSMWTSLWCTFVDVVDHLEIRDPFFVGYIDGGVPTEHLRDAVYHFYSRAIRAKRIRQTLSMTSSVSAGWYLEWGIQ